MNGSGPASPGIIVDPEAPRCPDCGSANVAFWLPLSPPLSRQVIIWIVAVAYAALAAWFWANTRTVLPRTFAHPDPVNHRHLGDVVATSAAVLAGWWAGIGWLSKHKPARATHVCASCGARFTQDN